MPSTLTPWTESLVVAAIAMLAFFLGRWFSQLPKPRWLIGHFMPLGLILLYCLAIFKPQLTLVPPLSWMLIGRSRFVCFDFITTMVLSAPLAPGSVSARRVGWTSRPVNTSVPIA